MCLQNHRIISLYPIVESSIAVLNSADIDVATATIQPSLNPGLLYHRNQADVWNSDGSIKDVCDYIEDYRSGSILDVIGSVGGLFALLQAAHLLLFGRPLFWGLAGAKAISPFGLMGGYFSSSFRRRLKEEYHSTSDEGTDTIRIVRFLCDFVIDFGPADLDREEGTGKKKTELSPTLVTNEEESVCPQIRLVQMNSDATDTPQNENDPDKDMEQPRDHDRTHNIV
ncbi:hypothetical protein B0J17DRAFT_661716 [Rhizoctonia solani]|nr:hypothetical protein B0J17DRAFT_661716 [Rhizoctonia solani]